MNICYYGMAALLFCTLPPAVTASTTEPISASATIARDINGFSLGMKFSEANKLAKLEPIGGTQYQTVKDGIEFNLDFTPDARIYRVSSSQNLGKFKVDRPFLKSLEAKLSKKYGKPDRVSGEGFSWDLIQQVENRSGHKYPYRTMWMSTYVLNGTGGVELNMTLIDFRILWQDQAKVNRKPRQSGSDKVQF